MDIIYLVAEELASEELDYELCLERLSDLAEDPVMINSASEEEVSRLFFLNPFQVKELCSYIKSSGQVVSIYEIASIPGFTKETAIQMMPFISLEQARARTTFFGQFKSVLLTNLTFSGKPDTSWFGSHARFLAKYKLTTGRFTTGFTLDKDPGEKLFTSGKPEFLSGFISYKGQGFLRKIIAGDYSARFGHGTAVNTGYGMGLQLTTTNYLAGRNEIRPYTSSAENNFFRGVAAELGSGKFSATLYLSSDRADASLSPDSLRIESFYTSGLHRTASEFAKLNTVRVVSYGINLRYEAANTRAGFVMSEERLSLPLTQKYEPGDLFSFRGDNSKNYSVYYSSLFSRFLFSGELSFNGNFNHAIVQGISAKLADRLVVNTLFRSYQPGYTSLHGRGPGSSTGSWNERSIFGGFTFEAARHLFVAAGCDFRQYPWLRYRCSAPSSTVRQEIRIRYLPVENLSAELLYNRRVASYDEPGSPSTAIQKEMLTHYARGSIRYSPSDNFTLTTRLDYKNSVGEGSGTAFIQDLMYKFRRAPLSLWFRYSLFSVSDWDARIYAYENDLLYSFSIPALSGQGSRSYIMLKWEAGDFGEVRIKYGITGTKNPESEDREDIRFQVRLFF